MDLTYFCCCLLIPALERLFFFLPSLCNMSECRSADNSGLEGYSYWAADKSMLTSRLRQQESFPVQRKLKWQIYYAWNDQEDNKVKDYSRARGKEAWVSADRAQTQKGPNSTTDCYEPTILKKKKKRLLGATLKKNKKKQLEEGALSKITVREWSLRLWRDMVE